ncbi:MAG: hypothetical protein QMO91_05095, partial [Candidatus Tisiphia sp.]|nr:hypothetical protein [Candidatus Tisiphia sp.]
KQWYQRRVLSIAHSRLKSPKLGELIQTVSENQNMLDIWQLANLQETKRRIVESNCIDDDLRKKYVTASAKCELIWRNAKKNNDYLSLKPYLQTVLDCIQEMAKSKAKTLNCTEYDALLDTYDPQLLKVKKYKTLQSIITHKFILQSL